MCVRTAPTWTMARKFAAVALVAITAAIAAAACAVSAGLPMSAPVLRLLGAPVEEAQPFPVAIRAAGHMVGPPPEEEAAPEVDWTVLALCLVVALIWVAISELL